MASNQRMTRRRKAAVGATLLSLLSFLPSNAQYDRYHNGNGGSYNNFNNGLRQGGRGGDYYNRHDDRYRNDRGGIGPGKGALIGGAGGAVLGAVFGGGLKGTLIGGAAGAGIGAAVGGVAQGNRRDRYGRPY